MSPAEADVFAQMRDAADLAIDMRTRERDAWREAALAYKAQRDTVIDELGRMNAEPSRRRDPWLLMRAARQFVREVMR